MLKMSYDVIIIGAGPGGLSCALAAASHGLRTLVVERKHILGKKVCAGGITWNGLMQKVPSAITEKKFAEQKIFTRLQQACVSSPTPMVATVNREKLGQKMAEQAVSAGVEIRHGCQVISIDSRSILCEEKATGAAERLSFTYLVGADGSSSVVRRWLGLPVGNFGVGINYQIPGDFPEMQWHLDSSLFANGYAWIFPHKETVSIGAYVDARRMKAHILKGNLLLWADTQGLPLRQHKPSAELINFDYRGWQFDNVFLVGDAAGLASGLTGEGIYSAIVSGQTVGNFLADRGCDSRELKNLIKNHIFHRKIVSLTGQSRVIGIVASEIVTFFLKTKLLGFNHLEMAR